jgi:hypothetical protein
VAICDYLTSPQIPVTAQELLVMTLRDSHNDRPNHHSNRPYPRRSNQYSPILPVSSSFSLYVRSDLLKNKSSLFLEETGIKVKEALLRSSGRHARSGHGRPLVARRDLDNIVVRNLSQGNKTFQIEVGLRISTPCSKSISSRAITACHSLQPDVTLFLLVWYLEGLYHPGNDAR